jgi:hypothetical protein
MPFSNTDNIDSINPTTFRVEQAVARAFRAAMAEYVAGPCEEPDDAAYTAMTALIVAHWGLRQAFAEPVAPSLADALAKAACKSFHRGIVA